jgi:hypothetical protein
MQVQNSPFCEECDAWYVDTAEGAFTTTSSEPLIQALESGSLEPLRSVVPTSKREYPHLATTLKKCPSCERADYFLAISLDWEAEKTEGTETKIEQRDEPWLTTMVPVEVGMQIEGLLA